MPTPTYTPIAEVTLASTDTQVSFTSISSSYRDLIMVINYKHSYGGSTQGFFTINSDTASNYYYVVARGDGSTTNSFSAQDNKFALSPYTSTSSTQSFVIMNFMDYSATDKHKSILYRESPSANGVVMSAYRWASTSAINRLDFTVEFSSYAAGSTFALYGIAA